MKNYRLALLFALITISLLLTVSVYQLRAKKSLRVAFFDVGQGDSILITTPRGGHILVVW